MADQSFITLPGQEPVLNMGPGRTAALKLLNQQTGTNVMAFEEVAPPGLAVGQLNPDRHGVAVPAEGHRGAEGTARPTTDIGDHGQSPAHEPAHTWRRSQSADTSVDPSH